MKRLFASTVIAAAMVAPAAGQGASWTQITTANSPSARRDHAMAFDSVRGKVVMFGGYTVSTGLRDDTWEYDGVSWSQITTSTRPNARYAHATAFDSARGKLVLFGGNISNNYLNDTWEYDGVNWARATTANSPPARSFHTTAYDSSRGKLVLFGGYDNNGNYLNDTWEYDGVNWTEVITTTSPSARRAQAMIYDDWRAKLVMFGGIDCCNFFDDTWEYDGGDWTQVTTATSPVARRWHAMAYDKWRAKPVMFGGYYSSYLSDTREFDGVDWTQPAIATSPGARRSHAMAYDSWRAKTVLFGGYDNSHLNDTWEYDGGVPPGPTAEVTTSTLTTTATPPPVRDHALASLPAGGALLFGGEASYGPFALTYELHGTDWSKQFSFLNPMARTGHALQVDGARQNNVMFGGENFAGAKLADTWTYQSGQWSDLAPATSPSPRSHHAMAPDPNTDAVLLFGGEDAAGGAIADMWSWDGIDWSQITPATMPPARSGHGLAWDELRDVLVLFGGADGTTRLDDVWEWDGTDWLHVPPAPYNGAAYGPAARDQMVMAYDPYAERVMVSGGETDTGCAIDAWTWDGIAWLRLLPTNGTLPSGRRGAQLVFDTAANQLRLHGGGCGAQFSAELWSFQLPAFARSDSFGAGCAGSNGVPMLSVVGGTLPVLGATLDFAYDNGPTILGITPIMSVGFDDESFQGLPLPLPLAALGLPGCTLYHSGEVSESFVATPTASQFTWSLSLPNNAGFLGQEFFFQGLHLELPPAANWAALSNAVGIRIGDQ
jgi:hypothetical protein